MKLSREPTSTPALMVVQSAANSKQIHIHNPEKLAGMLHAYTLVLIGIGWGIQTAEAAIANAEFCY